MNRKLKLTDTQFQLFSILINKKSGLNFHENNRIILESRVSNFCRKHEYSIDELYKLLKTDTQLFNKFADSATTNLTRFFRNDGHFDALQKSVIAQLVDYKKNSIDKSIRVWSAGCSTGEEPYSVACYLQEFLPPDFTFKIIATDISYESLKTARQGFYSSSKMDNVPEVYKTKYFNQIDTGYQVKSSIRNKVLFDFNNILSDNTNLGYDIIFCRNVLIYFDKPTFKKAAFKFYDSLNSFSFLFIGHSESLYGLDTKFKLVSENNACFYMKDVSRGHNNG